MSSGNDIFRARQREANRIQNLNFIVLRLRYKRTQPVSVHSACSSGCYSCESIGSSSDDLKDGRENLWQRKPRECSLAAPRSFRITSVAHVHKWFFSAPVFVPA